MKLFTRQKKHICTNSKEIPKSIHGHTLLEFSKLYASGNSCIKHVVVKKNSVVTIVGNGNTIINLTLELKGNTTVLLDNIILSGCKDAPPLLVGGRDINISSNNCALIKTTDGTPTIISQKIL